jgi:hypothetical protein
MYLWDKMSLGWAGQKCHVGNVHLFHFALKKCSKQKVQTWTKNPFTLRSNVTGFLSRLLESSRRNVYNAGILYLDFGEHTHRVRGMKLIILASTPNENWHTCHSLE